MADSDETNGIGKDTFVAEAGEFQLSDEADAIVGRARKDMDDRAARLLVEILPHTGGSIGKSVAVVVDAVTLISWEYVAASSALEGKIAHKIRWMEICERVFDQAYDDDDMANALQLIAEKRNLRRS